MLKFFGVLFILVSVMSIVGLGLSHQGGERWMRPEDETFWMRGDKGLEVCRIREIPGLTYWPCTPINDPTPTYSSPYSGQ